MSTKKCIRDTADARVVYSYGSKDKDKTDVNKLLVNHDGSETLLGG